MMLVIRYGTGGVQVVQEGCRDRLHTTSIISGAGGSGVQAHLGLKQVVAGGKSSAKQERADGTQGRRQQQTQRLSS